MLAGFFWATACNSEAEGPEQPSTCTEEACSICELSHWSLGGASAETDLVVAAGQTVTVDCSIEARTVTIEAGGTLMASRTESSRITLHGNLVVRGTLDYGTPDSRIPASVTAEIVFTGMNDASYLGTPSLFTPEEDARGAIDTQMVVLASDIGLWVMGDGRLLAAGQPKRAWGTLIDGAAPGDSVFTVDDASGWSVGDRVMLTPTVETSSGIDYAEQFDEAIISAVDGNRVTLATDPHFDHAGCSDCMRRGEASNLTRNVVIRSADDTAHAHVMVAERGIAQLDSVEFRWLGPEQCGGPARRAPLYFHQQSDAAEASFLRHLSVWGGQHHSIVIEKSNGIETSDLAGYDSYGDGFSLWYDISACQHNCMDRAVSAPQRIVWDHVLAAKIGVDERENCGRVNHRMTAIAGDGGEQTGVRNSVAVGIGWIGSGENVSGFEWAEGGSGRPQAYTFTNNVTHNSRATGAFVWHNGAVEQDSYTDNAFWSLSAFGIHWGAYDNAFLFERTLISDTIEASVGVKSIPVTDRVRMIDATIDDMRVLAYVFVQERVATFRDITWSGAKSVGVTQIQDPCVDGNENDPIDPSCVRVWLRFEDPVFPAGMLPFLFGETRNKFSVWEVRGFNSPDYADLPADFDLYRRDNEVAGGAYYEPFDAWLVPR